MGQSSRIDRDGTIGFVPACMEEYTKPLPGDHCSRISGTGRWPSTFLDEAAALPTLVEVGVEACVDSICDDIDAWNVERVVLVGHSLAGVTVPLVAERLRDRVVHVVLLAALVPPQAGSVVTSLSRLERGFVSRFVPPDQPFRLTQAMAEFGFATHLSPPEWEALQAQICPESSRLLYETVKRRPPPLEYPVTYVVHLRDRMLSVKRQRTYIRNLGHPVRIRTIDAGHSAFAARPAEVGSLLDEIADGESQR